jgi:hypothetical protein
LITQVDPIDRRGSVDVVLVPRAEVVKYGYFVTGGEERVHDMGTDEPSSTGHQNSHGD